MQVVALEDPAATRGASAVSIGAYDGVHLGHRKLLGLLRARADALGVPSVVVTFDRHPATVVRPGSAPLLLTDAEQKYELLAGCGVDVTVVVRFDERRAAEPAVDFVDEVLVRTLGARTVVVGEDFHFGNSRQGNVALLRELGSLQGFDVLGVSLEGSGGAADPETAVSSTRIRSLLGAGDVSGAAALLSRPHEVRGTVAHGDRRGGAELGIPTANVQLPEGIAIPRIGIYAGVCRRADGSQYAAAISLGVRPTFYRASGTGSGASGDTPLLEAHLLDFDGDLYGERVAVTFVERLRDERRFTAVEELCDQMRADIAQTRTVIHAGCMPSQPERC